MVPGTYTFGQAVTIAVQLNFPSSLFLPDSMRQGSPRFRQRLWTDLFSLFRHRRHYYFDAFGRRARYGIHVHRVAVWGYGLWGELRRWRRFQQCLGADNYPDESDPYDGDSDGDPYEWHQPGDSHRDHYAIRFFADTKRDWAARLGGVFSTERQVLGQFKFRLRRRSSRISRASSP